ncbi:hypothetical protein [Alkalihalobacillus sp. AL-G]|uniref:hypothetical protein n=1 Tax=Alkalihalobacillus sp. AL-G TaxID=2926399 RepID=UPI00272CDFB8|nr:hypothetical protein [Alkalihalobacillus sp. AL-G]WLD94973.1 hypothetical protein MOJ78_08865 [Alkalihalobacillus sp. AL-G]
MSCKADRRKCEGCVCEQFKMIDIGTVVQITLGDDEFFEDQDYTFLCLDPHDCCVTLIDTSDNNVFIVDCERIRGVKFINNTVLPPG